MLDAVRLPFPCDLIPREHRFDVVRNGEEAEGRILSIEVPKNVGIHAIRLCQNWRCENDEIMQDIDMDSFLVNGEAAISRGRGRVWPYVALHIDLGGKVLSWYWHGNGSYDGFSMGRPETEE